MYGMLNCLIKQSVLARVFLFYNVGYVEGVLRMWVKQLLSKGRGVVRLYVIPAMKQFKGISVMVAMLMVVAEPRARPPPKSPADPSPKARTKPSTTTPTIRRTRRTFTRCLPTFRTAHPGTGSVLRLALLTRLVSRRGGASQ